MVEEAGVLQRQGNLLRDQFEEGFVLLRKRVFRVIGDFQFAERIPAGQRQFHFGKEFIRQSLLADRADAALIVQDRLRQFDR